MSDDTARIDLKDCTCEWMPTTDGGQSLVQDITCPFHMKGGQRLFDAVAHIYEAMRASSASHGPTEHATRKHLDDALAALRTPGGDEGDRTEDGLCECGHGADRHKCRDCRCDSFSVPEATPAESREIEDCSECGRATLEGECPACLGDRTEDGTGALCRYCGAPESRWSFDRCSYPGPHGHRDPAPSDAAPDVPGEGDVLDDDDPLAEWDEWSDCPLCRKKPCHCGIPKSWTRYFMRLRSRIAQQNQRIAELEAREADAPEPVAWRWERWDGQWESTSDEWAAARMVGAGMDLEPLYARPPAVDTPAEMPEGESDDARQAAYRAAENMGLVWEPRFAVGVRRIVDGIIDAYLFATPSSEAEDDEGEWIRSYHRWKAKQGGSGE